MVHHELLRDQGILIVTPQSSLQKADFEMLAEIVDPFIASEGELNGLMIYVESFPGWSDLGALLAHLKFVKDHQRFIEKIAAVTDSGILSILPRIVHYFIHPQIKHFDYSNKQEALAWLETQEN